MLASTICIVGLVSLVVAEPGDRPAPSKSPRVEPVVGLSSRLMYRSLSIDRNSKTDRSYQLMSKPVGLHGGVQWYWGRDRGFHTGGLRSTAGLGLELLLPTGGLPLSVQANTGYEWKVRPRLSVFLGGQVQLALDLPSTRYSHGTLGIPLALSTRRLDITWAPSMSFPLKRELRTVFGEPVRRNVAVMVMPLNLSLTVKLGRNARSRR